MDQTLLCSLVCPVILGNRLDETSTSVKQILGTAFALGDNFYLTAGHCLPERKENEVFGLGYPLPESHGLGIVLVRQAEYFESHDLALLEAAMPVPFIKPQVWSFGNMNVLTEVWTAGYPHGLDSSIAEMGFVAQRAFKGHTVSHLPHKRLPDGSFLDVYELSFMAPKGISGAPLFLQSPEWFVVGVVLGMKQTDTNVVREIEATDEGKTVEFHWYVQRMTYGFAVTSKSLAPLHSGMLNMTIGDYIRSKNLVVD
jgi:hypothetical protein